MSVEPGNHLKGVRRPKWISPETWTELRALDPYDQDRLAQMLEYKPIPSEIQAGVKAIKRELEQAMTGAALVRAQQGTAP